MSTIRLDGRDLGRGHVVSIARADARVELDVAALDRVRATADFLAEQLARGEPLYGVTTGFGSNADKLLGERRQRPAHLSGADADESLVAELQRKLIESHAVCVGEPLPRDVVRAMMAIRVNTLLQGHSGVRAETLEQLVACLNADLLPVIPAQGSVGASGDLAPLSHQALMLLGRGEAFLRGERMPAGEGLAAIGLRPLVLSFKEGLALNNGTTLMLAIGVLALDDMERLIKTADITAALSMEAFCARSAALDARVHAARPHPGQIATADNLRRLLDGSGLIDQPYHQAPRFHPWSAESWPDGAASRENFDLRWRWVPLGERAGREAFFQRNLPFRGGKKAQPQDSYSLRCVPQVHGAVKDARAHAARVFEIELNAVTDNPLVFPEDGSVVSAGNFHGMPLALALAHLKSALPVLASIAERRIAKLTDPATSDGLPPFLIANPEGTDSGLMIVQYTAAALVNALATRAHPAAVYSVPTSANAEDHVSMGATDALDLLAMLRDVEQVLAIELFTATQALELRQRMLDAASALAADPQRLAAKIDRPLALAPEAEARFGQELAAFAGDLRERGPAQGGAAAEAVLAAVRRSGISFLDYDRVLTGDLATAADLVRRGVPVREAEAALSAPLSV
ncbi:HAL/PAL/TAL family ammonia-lyase [Pseudofulvimonas gallinarii]|uniref:Histidine ammonia-lyase n=1 Tax=Pseudofulvimonas gallinarii TaxID=634155 RepID=A0A4S3KZH2_9GAMM|nr:aromatic amino acid lyase [Pseudofulvimonas gallinarii]TCS99606.1 histidine ammonia-lyase [Pseudofulvimonas gallinarii]THD14823.1 histidine ammonia-lyase [Pseudofulvimonas gallinarii]